MKKSFWSSVRTVVERCDIVLYLLDARYPQESRNKQLEALLKKRKRKVLYVFTKADLNPSLQPKIRPFVLMSSTQRQGLRELKQQLSMLAPKTNDKIKIGVVGYPNVGKSSLLNYIKGKKSSSTSSQPGHTKGVQYIVTSRFLFFDTPGVIPKAKQQEIDAVKIGAVKAKDPEHVALTILEQHHGLIEKELNISVSDDKYETLEHIALAKNFLKKGGKPALERASQFVIKTFQELSQTTAKKP